MVKQNSKKSGSSKQVKILKKAQEVMTRGLSGAMLDPTLAQNFESMNRSLLELPMDMSTFKAQMNDLL